MTLHTPLTVAERWRHRYDVFPDISRTQPFGSGATYALPVLDLQIENRTTSSFRLACTSVRRTCWATWSAGTAPMSRDEIYELGHLMANAGPGIFMRHNVVRRRIFILAATRWMTNSSPPTRPG